MTSELWARIRQIGSHGLRRGAWYPVVNEVTAEMLLLDVARRNVPVPREALDVSERAPAVWSVVEWRDQDQGAGRVREAGFDLTYGVCPKCRARVSLPGERIERLQCPECGGDFPVDWERRC
jgi:hypothetical protein